MLSLKTMAVSGTDYRRALPAFDLKLNNETVSSVMKRGIHARQ
jgi:hypothetical protein